VVWSTRVELVTRPGKGPRRLRPPDDVLRRVRALRGEGSTAGAAGHAEGQGGGEGSGCGPDGGAAGHGGGPDLWEQARQRVVAHLDRAARYQAWLDEHPNRSAAELAKQEGLSRARVSQTLSLGRLPPEVVADLRRSDRTGAVPREKDLWVLARMANRWNAVERYRKLVAQDPEVAPVPRGPKQRGFQHQLERARRYQAMLDAGEHETVASIGRAEGLSYQRVGQLLQLLQLAPDLVAALDVPPDRLPGTLSSRAVRELSMLRDHAEQRRRFAARWPGALADASVAAK
jgi:hypothetical protein